MHGCREQAVVARTGRGCDSVRHFTLHHENGKRNCVAVAADVLQNWRCDVVGEISDDAKFFAASAQRTQVDVENVGLKDLDGRELLAEPCGKGAVKFDSDETRCPLSESLSDCAGARADFDDCLMRNVTESIDDGRAGGRVDQEILPEFWLLLHRSPESFGEKL